MEKIRNLKQMTLGLGFCCLLAPLSAIAQTKTMHHPEAANGLIRIEKDGSYIYKTKELKSNRSSSIKLGLVEPPVISSFYQDSNGQEQELTFEDMYGGDPIAMFNYEYEWKVESMPMLRYHAGAAFFLVEGRGRLISTNEESQEKFTFIGLPLNAGLTLRFEFSSKQSFVPYITGGGTYYLTAELRDDKSTPKFFGVWGGYAGAGGMLSISKISRDTSFALQNEYGLSNLWIMAEFRYLKTTSEMMDFGVGYGAVGIAADF